MGVKMLLNGIDVLLMVRKARRGGFGGRKGGFGGYGGRSPKNREPYKNPIKNIHYYALFGKQRVWISFNLLISKWVYTCVDDIEA